MRILILLSGLVILNYNCLAQNSINLELKATLKTVLEKDQGIREFLDSETSEQRKDSLCNLLHYPKDTLIKNSQKIMQKYDFDNLKIVEEIIAKYGYPGKTLVGTPENTAAFYVIQHSRKIPKYFSIIKKAGKDNELPLMYVAMMQDRLLTQQKKEQIFGTQISTVFIKNANTGQEQEFSYVMPIKDPERVNERRKEAGFKTTVEVNAMKFGIKYQVYTYQQLALLLGSSKP